MTIIIVPRLLARVVLGLLLMPLGQFAQRSLAIPAQSPAVLLAGDIASAPEPLDDGWWMSSSIAFVVTQSGLIRTTDAGRSWKAMALSREDGSSSGAIRSIRFASEVLGWIVSDSGVWQTTDGGVQWRLIAAHGRLAAPISTTTAWLSVATAHGEQYYVTKDQGKRWSVCGERDQRPSANFTRVAFMSTTDARGITLTELHPGYRYSVHLSIDGGCSWRTLWELPSFSDDRLESLFFLNSKEGWMGGEGSIYHSKDSGLNWEVISSLKGVIVADIYFLSPMTGWLLAHSFGQPGGVFTTGDGGRTWRRVLMPDVGSGASGSPFPVRWNRGNLVRIILGQK